ESLLLLRRQPQGLDKPVKMGIALAASIIKVHNTLEAGQAAVVHVRCRLGNLAQSRCLKSPAIFDNACHPFAAFVGETASIPPDTQIVEQTVAEGVTLMAKAAVSFTFEQLQTFSRFRAQRSRVAGYISIVGRISSQNGALKAREGLGQVLAR